MKRFLVLSLLCVCVMPAFGAGRSMVANERAASRTVIAPGKFNSSLKNNTGLVSGVIATDNNDANRVAVVDDDPQPAKDNRAKERLACISNNIGVGNTFVWASRNSNTSNYASMVEDTENPENNVCFVLVGMRSDDSRINVSDIQPRYFELGQNITCGSWIDDAKMQARILDAKKTARTLGTIGGAVGGAGVGVGAMELFGNKLIGGAVMGQQQYEENTTGWFVAKANELKQENKEDYNKFVEYVEELKKECKKESPDSRCEKYQALLDVNLAKAE